jgi:hypothetical protein
VSSRWWSPFDGMAEMPFKPVPEGWVYGAPNPWLFGSRQYYVVTDEQKSALASELRRTWRLLFVAMIVVIGAMVPMVLSALVQHPFAGFAAAMLVGLVLGAAFNAYLYRKIQPAIAGLTPTTQRITQGEAFGIQVSVFSRRYILFFGLLSLALFALTALPPLLTSARFDPWSLGGGLLFGACAIYWFALYRAKSRQSAG